jgi:hypothetical protein
VRTAVASLLVALVVAPPAAAAPIKAKLVAGTPTPTVEAPWRYTITVRSASGAPLRARAKLQLLLGTTVVGCSKGGAMVQCFSPSDGDWITFKGRRTGVLRFPEQAVGVRLTFQATVKADGQTRKLRAPVTVQAKPPEPLP